MELPLMIKFLIPIGLVIGSTVNGAPCYTDIKDGCDKNAVAIFVETKNTENGFCSEYINEQKQKVVRCYTTPPTPPESEPEKKNIVNTQPAPQQNQPIITPVIYQNQQINNYNSDNNYNGSERVSYWDGYWNGYNNFQGGYPNRPPPPPQNHRPPRPQRPPVNTASSMPIGQQHNGLRGQSAVPANTNNRPNYQRPQRPHRPQGNMYNRDDRPRSSAPLKR